MQVCRAVFLSVWPGACIAAQQQLARSCQHTTMQNWNRQVKLGIILILPESANTCDKEADLQHVLCKKNCRWGQNWVTQHWYERPSLPVKAGVTCSAWAHKQGLGTGQSLSPQGLFPATIAHRLHLDVRCLQGNKH
jgi:hypothetical protein